MSSHAELIDGDSTRGRYYLDRIDVSNPSAPILLKKVNIPGRAVHIEENGRLLTLETHYSDLGLDQEACWDVVEIEPGVFFQYTDVSDSSVGNCTRETHSLNLLMVNEDQATLLQTTPIEADGWYLSQLAITDERAFVLRYQARVEEEVYEDYTYRYWTTGEQQVLALDGTLQPIAEFDAASEGSYYGAQLRARGKRAFQSFSGQLRVYDTADVVAPEAYDRDTVGYDCQELEVAGDQAFCAQGKQGVATIQLK